LVRAATLEVHALLARIRFLRVFDAHELLNALALLDSELSAPVHLPPAAFGDAPVPESSLLSMADLPSRTTLLVVDSLSSVVLPLLSRAEDRSLTHALLAEAGCRLRWMARRHNLAVLVTTYASTDPTEEDTAIDSVAAAAAEAAVTAAAASATAVAISTAAEVAAASAAVKPSAAFAVSGLSSPAAGAAVASAFRDAAAGAVGVTGSAMDVGDGGAGSLEVYCDSSSGVNTSRETGQGHVFSLDDLRAFSTTLTLESGGGVSYLAQDLAYGESDDDDSDSRDALVGDGRPAAGLAVPVAHEREVALGHSTSLTRLDVESGARVELARTEALRVSLGLTWAIVPDASILLVADAQQRLQQVRSASLFRGSGQTRDDDTIRVDACDNTATAVFKIPTVLRLFR
jgi:hypothetical protein